ncbi:MAG TPA: glycosyltransferase [Solirubrobacteraceae bacterium]|nr:glycosyltransferase [Solirubrobacteraceae bacterium]
MRVCVVYDCLFPHTIGGGERWYRSLSERLAAEGHEVTYLTLRQWPREGRPDAPAGVTVRAAGPRMALYTGARRRVVPPVVFGAGVLWHLLRHGRRYDVVHTASFPYFSLLAAGLLRRAHGYRLVVDWFELWSRAYWLGYLGAVGGRVGWTVQRRCVHLRHQAFCFARLTAARLHEEDVSGPVTVLVGMVAGRPEARPPARAEPLVVFAGRHIPEKRVPALVPALARARQRLPELRGAILGDGPQRKEVLGAVRELGLTDVVDVPGFVDAQRLQDTLRRALCMVLPSEREGYGMVVVEAAASGTPSVVCAAPDNAAVELVEEGVNGTVAPDASAEALAAAIERVHAAGHELRSSTHDWYLRNARRLSLEASLDRVSAAYRGELA